MIIMALHEYCINIVSIGKKEIRKHRKFGRLKLTRFFEFSYTPKIRSTAARDFRRVKLFSVRRNSSSVVKAVDSCRASIQW
jgi:hypothetical protein